ncbi:SAVED domain-containing protein [Bacillus sp. ISL-39]|uniref:SAVED domain-containing protein n=1 Tax=Bacillus sp. ISL-39 TaxID=2819124 RepID=UPI001BE76D63|nr:SAVED domain-containing protein [Bacillus sp. ISL-39]MBT2639371.1 SAVED domain-containing protein [Bacillus sp. ISL-39]
MADPIKARNLGDDYQALFFWLKACDMLSDYSNIDTISYEDPEIKSLDDVVIKYKNPIKDINGNLIYKEFYQVKFHVDYRNSLTVDNLMDPNFINASKFSFLQKVKAASHVLNKKDELGTAIFVTPWSLHPDDELAKLKIIDAKGGYFLLENLFDGKKRSFVSKLRDRLKAHLELSDDKELKEILRPIQIMSNFHSLDGLTQLLNSRLPSVGLKPINLTERVNPYVSLIRRLFQEGNYKFTREDLIAICKDEKLWLGSNIMFFDEKPVGIRSFSRRAENMENDTTAMICFQDYFNGRYLKDEYCWNENIKRIIEDFTLQSLQEGHSYCIYLDTHSAIAFTAGHYLDPKSGLSIVPVQKGLKGREIWRPNQHTRKEEYSLWEVENHLINENGEDIVIIIEMTHSAYEDVKSYIDENKVNVKSIIRFYFESGPSFNTIQDGIHALILANELSNKLNNLEKGDRRKPYHFFGSGPNGFWFFLGQLSKNFGSLTLYEYDFEVTKDYIPTIQLP